MEQIILEIGKQVPALVVLGYILRQSQAVHGAQMEALRDIIRADNAVLKENSAMMGRVAQALESLPHERKAAVQT